MGQRYVYKLKFKDAEKDLVGDLLAKGLLHHPTSNEMTDNVDNEKKLVLDLDLRLLDGKENSPSIPVWREGDFLCYAHNWSPDDRISYHISDIFPNDTIVVDRSFDVDNPQGAALWYERGGHAANKDGVPITGGIMNLSKKLVKECGNGKFRARFNLGEKGWVSVYFSEKDMWSISCKMPSGGEEISGYAAMFVKDTVAIYDGVQVGGKEIPVDDFLDAYYDSKQAYIYDMRSGATLSGLPSDAFRERQNANGDKYYLVDIPVTSDVAESGNLTVTAKEEDVDPCAGTVMLGYKGKVRNAMTSIGDNSRLIRIEISNNSILQGYEQSIYYRTRVNRREDNTELQSEIPQELETQEEMER